MKCPTGWKRINAGMYEWIADPRLSLNKWQRGWEWHHADEFGGLDTNVSLTGGACIAEAWWRDEVETNPLWQSRALARICSPNKRIDAKRAKVKR